ncbi:RNA-binding protein [Dyella solisilvae]|uniref:RNA-binding protein n=1 Tax=Dyella solisilvae TaxID=1920168 RepID=A0A370K9D0_9GAMM|nr:RNA-binding protein [Dyella solisilvae]RDI99251.1 RNA-binding protein [Dyella solisilvae]
MGRLLLGNIAPDTSDEELKEFLHKYGFPPVDDIEQVPGDGSRPAVLLTFGSCRGDALELLRERVHQMYWKGRQLNVIILSDQIP